MRTRFAGWSEEEIANALEQLERWRDRVLDGARIDAGETVADVGAGTGLLTLGAVERVGPDGDVLALDISVDALEELRRNTTAPNISYLIGRADILPLPDESVDAAVSRPDRYALPMVTPIAIQIAANAAIPTSPPVAMVSRYWLCVRS